jgi:hypothetical protein
MKVPNAAAEDVATAAAATATAASVVFYSSVPLPKN